MELTRTSPSLFVFLSCPLEVLAVRLSIQRQNGGQTPVDQVPSEYAAKEEDVIGLRAEEEPYEGLLVSRRFLLIYCRKTRPRKLILSFCGMPLFSGCGQDDHQRRRMDHALYSLDRDARRVAVGSGRLVKTISFVGL